MKNTIAEYAEKAAYACLGMAAYGPRAWALVSLALCAVMVGARWAKWSSEPRPIPFGSYRETPCTCDNDRPCLRHPFTRGQS